MGYKYGIMLINSYSSLKKNKQTKFWTVANINGSKQMQHYLHAHQPSHTVFMSN